VIDVKVKQSHWWRVRAFRGQDKNNYGPWSACVRFDTLMPIVELKAPANNEAVYPWGLKLEWSPVTGAATYTLERTRHPEGFVSETPVEIARVKHPQHEYPQAPQDSPINLPPRLTILNEKYWWRVGVTGPEIVPETGQPFRQDGDTSAPRAAINDGSQTV